MMTDAERRLMTDLELLHDKWAREWARHALNGTQPTLEEERVHLHEFKKVIVDHWGFDSVNIEGYLK